MKSLTYIIILFSCLSLSEQSVAKQGSNINNEQYQRIEKAIADYEKLKEKNQWSTISLGQSALKVNDQSPAIKEIKQRLEVLGDFRALSNTDVYNQRFEAAVKRFQARHGLEETGIINAEFVKALNVPLETRINQLRVNLDRIRKENIENTGRHIVANIPEYKLRVYEGEREVLSMDIVVGKTTNKTVVFKDMMNQIVFSPYWNIPESIVKNEILPAMKKNSRYLQNNRMEIIGTKNGLPDIRQKPGPKNSLGKVKFLFPNKYNIYFHDTPAKTLFSRRTRAFSHGCIRLSQPFELAKYLLKDDPKWNDAAIHSAMNAGTERYVTLKSPVPVSISYYTAWVDPSGDVHFREDIYGKDGNLAKVD
ncbi:murein L,D-transpeptidase [Paradesertivirga mongoliensis]|uniref:Murein L,D-transpeptidase n=1 Tax=Paradesertivirga mongoliensis TaxID=2100740 RepID=A0ABW4ZNM4_9SPHI|nr:L,D-transpeptidase family protein [Pedobacter mongoliensis]